MRVLVTGANGRVFTLVRPLLAAYGHELVLVDRTGGDGVVAADFEAALDLVPTVDAVLHLAGISDEARYPDLLEANPLGTQLLLEAARKAGTRRVVVASSSRVTGAYPVEHVVHPDDPVRPDGLYAASKVAVEAVCRMYADKFGLSVVTLRIGRFEAEPSGARSLAMWLSPRDAAGFFHAALTVPGLTYTCAYAVSRNTRRLCALTPGLYDPVDDAEGWADVLDGADAYPEPGSKHGAFFASPEFTEPYL